MEKLQANFVKIENKIINLSQIVDVVFLSESVQITTTELKDNAEHYVHRFTNAVTTVQVKKFFESISFDVACFDDEASINPQIIWRDKPRGVAHIEGLYSANEVL